MRYSPAILASVANHLLNVRTDLQSQRMFIQQLYEIMYSYANPETVSACVSYIARHFADYSYRINSFNRLCVSFLTVPPHSSFRRLPFWSV